MTQLGTNMITVLSNFYKIYQLETTNRTPHGRITFPYLNTRGPKHEYSSCLKFLTIRDEKI